MSLSAATVGALSAIGVVTLIHLSLKPRRGEFRVASVRSTSAPGDSSKLKGPGSEQEVQK
jgi:hypothetical protein